MDGQYLIPANSKRSMLILSLFAPIDLIIFGVGVGITLFLILLFNSQVSGLMDIVKLCIPAAITGIMLIPVPNHRNLWQFTVHIYTYFASQKQYKWRGWCMLHGEK